MTSATKNTLLILGATSLIVLTGLLQSWNTALLILNMGIISAILSIGVNLQWGVAGLFNIGIMGFIALGGLSVVLTSAPPVQEALETGGGGIFWALVFGALVVVAAFQVHRRLPKLKIRPFLVATILIVGYFVFRAMLDPAAEQVESINSASTGYLGGFGLPVLLSWPMGAILAGVAAWFIGRVALGLRADYLAIATLGIAEIIVAFLKHEDWLTRGVKNVIGLPRPVPYEIDLQESEAFLSLMNRFSFDPVVTSSIVVKLSYSFLFSIVLLVVFVIAQLALKSPWGRMMRAIRDNEVSAKAMGKHIKKRHMEIFVFGSCICGLAGAMMTTLDSQLTPVSYQPLRFTFLIWLMVIVGGAGNNFGAVLGGFIIWFFWVQVEPIGLWLMQILTIGLAEDSTLKEHLIESAAHMRLLTMGLVLLLVLRFYPQGLIPKDK